MSDEQTAAGKELFSELLTHLKVNGRIAEKVKEITVQEAIQLGKNFIELNTFDLDNFHRGDIFQVTDVMIDLREMDHPDWNLVCNIVDHMPDNLHDTDPEPENPDSTFKIYKNLVFNMRHVRNGTEERSAEAVEKGFRILRTEEEKKAS